MATIKEVARRAGVGVGTVSRVLNNATAVHPDTRARVQRAIAELDYRPNHAARQLATSRTMTIGVVLPFLTRPFFVNVLQGIEATVVESAYHLTIFSVETAEGRNRYFETTPYRGRVDGLVIVSLPLDDAEVERFREMRIPVVMVDGAHPAVPSISMDNRMGAYLAVEYLIEQGHQRIGFVSGPINSDLGFPVNQQRLSGYQSALTDHGLISSTDYLSHDEDSHAAGVRMGNRLLDLAEPPTAIFALSDVHALGVLQAAQSRGLRVPEDIAIIGYDDIELAEYVGLTTMRQPMAEMGRRGVEYLLERLEQPNKPAQQEVLLPTLVRRRTA